MSLEMIYTTGDRKFSFNLAPSEVDFLDTFCKGDQQKYLDIIFGVPELGKNVSIERSKVLKAVSILLAGLKDAKEFSSHIYSFKIEMPPGSGYYSTGSGLFSGIHIDGQLYSIEGGLDTCKLTRQWQDESRVWHDEEKDVRDQKIIKTDDFGDIIIRKKKKPSELIHKLKDLESFLTNLNVDIIQKNLV
jgi:hypothetical protein